MTKETFMPQALLACLLQAVPCLAAGAGGSAPQVAADVRTADVKTANVRMNAPQLPAPHGQLGRAAETIAADAEGKLLVAAWETLQGNCGPPLGGPCAPPSAPGQTAIGYSTDGGRTWVDAGAPPAIEGAVTAGHPWLDRGGPDNRTFYLVSRGRNLQNGFLTGIVVHRGDLRDGAITWRDGRLFKGPNQGDILRSSSVVAAKDGSGAVYVALSNVRGLCGMASRGTGQIEVARSADGGGTWSEPVVVGADDTFLTEDPKDPRCGHTGTVQVGPSMALGPGGELYVLWPFGPVFFDYVPHPYMPPTLFHSTHRIGVRFARSTDGGKTFSAPRDLVTINSLREAPPVGFSKDSIIDYVRIAVAQDGPHRGRIYVTYPSAAREVADLPSTEQMPVSSQVYLIHSDDKGATWSAPAALAPPVPPEGVKRFWPAVAVQPGGTVDVVYAESQERQATPDPDDVECAVALPSGLFRRSTISSLVDLYRVQSRDGGASFGAPVKVTTETSNWCAAAADPGGFLFANFGDYLGIFPGRGRTYVVWTDARNGVPDAYFGEVRDGGAAGSPAEPASR